jgi:hypothetical protein
VLPQLDREQRGIGDRHDPVVLVVHDQHRHADGPEILGEIGLGESLDGPPPAPLDRSTRLPSFSSFDRYLSNQGGMRIPPSV